MFHGVLLVRPTVYSRCISAQLPRYNYCGSDNGNSKNTRQNLLKRHPKWRFAIQRSCYRYPALPPLSHFQAARCNGEERSTFSSDNPKEG